MPSLEGLEGLEGLEPRLDYHRIPPELFKETIAPLLLVEHTALIGITTPMDTGCDYSMMMDLKHADGTPMFNSLAITLMCDKCRVANLLECPHMEHEIPHWKRDKKRGALVQSIMSSDRALYLRENAGVITKAENTAFHHPSVDSLLATSYNLELSGNIRMPVFIAIDTAGGGR